MATARQRLQWEAGRFDYRRAYYVRCMPPIALRSRLLCKSIWLSVQWLGRKKSLTATYQRYDGSSCIACIGQEIGFHPKYDNLPCIYGTILVCQGWIIARWLCTTSWGRLWWRNTEPLSSLVSSPEWGSGLNTIGCSSPTGRWRA